jgi:hypothetical protein
MPSRGEELRAQIAAMQREADEADAREREEEEKRRKAAEAEEKRRKEAEERRQKEAEEEERKKKAQEEFNRRERLALEHLAEGKTKAKRLWTETEDVEGVSLGTLVDDTGRLWKAVQDKVCGRCACFELSCLWRVDGRRGSACRECSESRKKCVYGIEVTEETAEPVKKKKKVASRKGKEKAVAADEPEGSMAAAGPSVASGTPDVWEALLAEMRGVNKAVRALYQVQCNTQEYLRVLGAEVANQGRTQVEMAGDLRRMADATAGGDERDEEEDESEEREVEETAGDEASGSGAAEETQQTLE